MTRILIGTNNPSKVFEMGALLQGLEVLGLADVGLAGMDVEETADSFLGNALLKAVAYGTASGEITVADDSGICVEALQGAPGIYSARYAGHKASGEANNAKLLKFLTGQQDRSAHYHSTVVVYFPEEGVTQRHYDLASQLCLGVASTGGHGVVFYSEGKAHGRILEAPVGFAGEGFGYDSVFFSEEAQKSFGEITEVERQQVSHRAKALRPVIEFLSSL